ncbi:MAG TPA: hypothetical protein VF487_07590 [Chitinophagaceae bacterium]
MRIIITILLLLPVSMQAQISRSATELAKEITSEYISTKIFKDKLYQPLSFGAVKAWPDARSPISWTITHSFIITDVQRSGYNNVPDVQKTYSFMFYLDSKMKVLKASSYTSSQ